MSESSLARRATTRRYPVRSALRRGLASVTRVMPQIRGLGRCVLAADRWLTDSADPGSYEACATVNGNHRMILDLRTWEQKFAFYYGTYEPELISTTSRLFRGGNFYDIGASIGLYAVPMGLLCQQLGGCVRAFEPVPQNLSRLEAQLAENQLDSDVVKIERLALGAEPGTAMMDLCDDGKPGNAKITGAGQVPVEVTTLDAVWEQRGCESVDFIKIDTEGWDAHILQGGRKTVEKCQPNLLIEFNRERMTNHNIPLQPAWQFLVERLRYRVFLVGDDRTVREIYEPAGYENLFFVRDADVPRFLSE